MSFVVDLVSEDSFYVNLLLGLTKLLSKHQQITDIKLHRYSPCDKLTLGNWEQKNGVALPDDMRKFYLSTDGFSLTWNFKYADKELQIGHIYVRPLAEIVCATHILNEVITPENEEQPKLSEFSKILELDTVKNDTKIYLIYEKIESEPTIWILDKIMGWFPLCENFTKYFRMMLVHQGLPYWQYCAFNKALPTWIQEIYLLVAPHLLAPRPKKSKVIRETYIPELPHNHIDPVIFTTDSHNSRRYRR
ncbi:tubulin polyglutamylase complex subunit 2 [Chrysoperla carnea]|uniref:tubulin polyglutamylase complex subunit 2 n=1 Tax=Chrysoperla carnea TaxID=189513 RepID=UPI001D08FC70|nr:tubulin polyglutamylase complex subunit 2 [Chrysoperla carnea]